MAKTYWARFGTGNPASYSGLAPTFIHFVQGDGTTTAPPGITEIIASTGLYRFQYTPSTSIAFILDGATTGLADTLRYVSGALDPSDRIDETAATLIADIDLKIGSTASSFGSTSVDPGDLYGYLKRVQEILEGNASYLKSNGSWGIYSRGSSTLLSVKTLTANTTGVTKV